MSNSQRNQIPSLMHLIWKRIHPPPGMCFHLDSISWRISFVLFFISVIFLPGMVHFYLKKSEIISCVVLSWIFSDFETWLEDRASLRTFVFYVALESTLNNVVFCVVVNNWYLYICLSFPIHIINTINKYSVTITYNIA